MTKKFLITLSIFMNLIVGCSNNEPTIIPTNTSILPANTVLSPSAMIVPLTNTIVPPTANKTLSPPTDTQLPPSNTPVPSVVSPGPKDLKVLVYVPKNYGANLFLNPDSFDKLGLHVTLAGTNEKRVGCPAFGILPDLTMDVQFSDDLSIS